VARVHRLQHVDHLFTTGFPHDDPVRAHPKCVTQAIALRDGTFAFDVGRAAFHPAHMHLLQLQFGGVFDGQHAFGIVDER
jgi:hypothetical protein